MDALEGVLDGYPTPLRRLLGLEMAGVLLDQGDPGAALALIDRLKPLDLPGDARARLSLLEGMALARAGRPADADQAYQAAAAHGDADTAIRAAYLRTSLLTERGVLPTAQAVAALTGQRAGWRGHPWETKMLRRLAELQAAEGQDDDALATLQAALPQAQEPKAKAELMAELQNRLRQTLQAPGSAEHAPIAALARYRTYSPPSGGEAGDAALRMELARIAADTGLVDTAAALLDQSVAHGPPEPALTAANLALARAMAARGDRDGALARLRQPETAGSRPRSSSDRPRGRTPRQGGAGLVGSRCGAGGARSRFGWRGDRTPTRGMGAATGLGGHRGVRLGLACRPRRMLARSIGMPPMLPSGWDWRRRRWPTRTVLRAWCASMARAPTTPRRLCSIWLWPRQRRQRGPIGCWPAPADSRRPCGRRWTGCRHWPTRRSEAQPRAQPQQDDIGLVVGTQIAPGRAALVRGRQIDLAVFHPDVGQGSIQIEPRRGLPAGTDR